MFDNFFRMLPFLTMSGSLLWGIASRNAYSGLAIYFSLAMFAADAACWILKHGVFKSIYAYLGVTDLPLIGRGPRPEGATNCSFIPDTSGKPASSFGMPSGHTCDGFLAATFWTLYIWQSTAWPLHYKTIATAGLYGLAALEGESRVRMGCHTWGQVVMGSLFGLLFGYIAFAVWMRRGPLVKIIKQMGGKKLAHLIQ